MNAEIVAIGSELLLGVTIDTNSAYLARQLAAAGVSVFRKTVVGDNLDRIAAAVREALDRADLVICTGGLGPTVDDMTREAVAMAFGVALEFRPELMAQIEARFAAMGRPMSESNRTQAYVPQGARGIENPRGTAPIFLIEDVRGVVFVLPGVPSEMRYLFEHEVLPYLRNERGISDTILVKTLYATGLGESVIGERIADLMRLENPTVGISAKAALYELRIGAKAANLEEAEALIAPIETTLRERLGGYLLGDAPLPELIGTMLAARNLSLTLYEGSSRAPVYRTLTSTPEGVAALRGATIHPLDRPVDAEAAATLASAGAQGARDRWRSDLALGVQMSSFADERGFTPVAVVLVHSGGVEQTTRAFDLNTADGWSFIGTFGLETLRQFLERET